MKKIPQKICKHTMLRLDSKTQSYICIFCGKKDISTKGMVKLI